MKRVLFVCHGNICRSVMAEYILKNISSDFYVESRATTSEEIGNDIYPPVKKVLDHHGIIYQRHQARKISSEDYDQFDYILCMDQENLDDLEYLLPSSDKTFLLADKEIEDPWFTRDFETCYQVIYKAIKRFIDKVL